MSKPYIKTPSKLLGACITFLRDPDVDENELALDDALTHCAFEGDDYDIIGFLQANAGHPELESLIECLEYYSSQHYFDGGHESPVECGLFLIPVIIAVRDSKPIFSDDQATLVARSFRAHNFLDDFQSVAVLPNLLSIDQVASNFIQRKAVLLAMMGKMLGVELEDRLQSAIKDLTENTIECEESTLHLRFLMISVMGSSSDFIEEINDSDNENVQCWIDEVESILSGPGNDVLVSIETPDEFDVSIDHGILAHAIVAAKLTIHKFTENHLIDTKDCAVYIGRSNSEDTHEVFLYYKHGEKLLDAEKIQLPIPSNEGHLNSIIRQFMDAVMEESASMGIGHVDIIGFGIDPSLVTEAPLSPSWH